YEPRTPGVNFSTEALPEAGAPCKKGRMTLPLRIDYALAMSETIGEGAGLRDADLDAIATTTANAVSRVKARVDSGELGFWNLPVDHAAATLVAAYARQVPASITDVLILGIGGSSLGGRAVQHALAPATDLVDPSRARRRLHLPD